MEVFTIVGFLVVFLLVMTVVLFAMGVAIEYISYLVYRVKSKRLHDEQLWGGCPGWFCKTRKSKKR